MDRFARGSQSSEKRFSLGRCGGGAWCLRKLPDPAGESDRVTTSSREAGGRVHCSPDQDRPEPHRPGAPSARNQQGQESLPAPGGPHRAQGTPAPAPGWLDTFKQEGCLHKRSNSPGADPPTSECRKDRSAQLILARNRRSRAGTQWHGGARPAPGLPDGAPGQLRLWSPASRPLASCLLCDFGISLCMTHKKPS